MKASSIVEGSFSAFERVLHGVTRTYVGVVQCHMIKYGMQTCEEKQASIRAKMLAFDEEIASSRTHAERECSKIFFLMSSQMNLSQTMLEEKTTLVCTMW